MSYRLTYDSIGQRINSSIDPAAMTGQDKIMLFQFLLDHLGITERFHQESDETARAQKIITEQYDKFWKSR